jgi:hypothetical protein
MGAGYQVDVRALEGTVTKLYAIAEQLKSTQCGAAYNTVIGGGALGKDFAGATGLLGTHDAMQSWLTRTIGELQAFITEYGGQTGTVAANYTQQEDRTRQDLTNYS